MAFYKILMKAGISISGTVGSDQKVCAIEPRSVYRDQFYLNRPLRKFGLLRYDFCSEDSGFVISSLSTNEIAPAGQAGRQSPKPSQ